MITIKKRDFSKAKTALTKPIVNELTKIKESSFDVLASEVYDDDMLNRDIGKQNFDLKINVALEEHSAESVGSRMSNAISMTGGVKRRKRNKNHINESMADSEIGSIYSKASKASKMSHMNKAKKRLKAKELPIIQDKTKLNRRLTVLTESGLDENAEEDTSRPIQPILELNDNENFSDDSDGVGQSPVNFFFEVKGKGKFEDIEKERAFILKNIKKQHKPMDYSKLRRQEKAYIRKQKEVRDKRKDEISKKVAEMEKGVVLPKFKSENYRKIKEAYSTDRKKLEMKRLGMLTSRQNGKDYGKKIQTINFFVSKRKIQPSLDTSVGGNTTIESKYQNYGRFALREENTTKNEERKDAYFKQLKSIGNKYMDSVCFNFDKDKIETMQQKRKLKLLNVEKEQYNIDKRAPSVDYLKQLQANRKTFDFNISDRRIVSRSLDDKFLSNISSEDSSNKDFSYKTSRANNMIRLPKIQTNEDTMYYESMIRKYDNKIKQNEQKIKCNSYQYIQNSKLPNNMNELNDYYSKSIFAKLGFQEAMN